MAASHLPPGGGPVCAKCRCMQEGVQSRDPQTHAIIGAALEVHTILGPGFLEQVYQDALAQELDERRVPFEREVAVHISFKGRVLPSFYRVDFVCWGQVVLELKAGEQVWPTDLAQMINYLKASRFERGLILNFGRRSLEWKRVVFTAAMYGAGRRRSASVSEPLHKP